MAVIGTGKELKGLEAARDPEKLARLIARARGDEKRGRVVSVHIVRHRPGRRCVLRYDYREAGGVRRTLFGKLYANQRGKRTAAIHEALGRLAASSPELPRVPEFFAFLQRERMLLCDALPGEPFPALLGKAAGSHAARQTGCALAAFHRISFPLDRFHGGERERAVLYEAVTRLGTARPALAGKASAIARALDPHFLDARSIPPAVLHRDFHPAQVLIDGAAVFFLDLDDVAWGDPAIDVGNFLAHLTLIEARPGVHEVECAAFIEGYRTAGGPASEKRFAGARAATLVRLASLEPAGSERTEALLEEAARILVRGKKSG